MTRTETHRLNRIALETMIGRRDHCLDMAALAYTDVAEALRDGSLDPTDPADMEWIDHAEQAMAAWASERREIEHEAAELAKRCVPTVAIWALPMWLRTQMFGAQ